MEYLESNIYEVILRTYFYLEETGRTDSFARFPYLRVLTERFTEDEVKKAREDGGIQAERYWQLLRELEGGSGNKAEKGVLGTALDLCLAAMQIPEFAGYLNYYTGNMVTIQLACELEGIVCPDCRAVYRSLRQLQNVCQVDWDKIPLQYAAIEGNNRLLAYLTGYDRMDAALLGKAEWFYRKSGLHPMFIREELVKTCAERMQNMQSSSLCAKEQEDGCGAVLQISGAGGRRFLAKHVAGYSGSDLLFVEADRFRESLEDGMGQFRTALFHELFLQKGMLCIYGITGELLEKMQMKETDFLKKVVLPFLQNGTRVILCTGIEVRFAGQFCIPRVELEALTRAEREKIFRGFAGLYGLSIDCVQYSVCYRLSASEIANALQAWQNAGGEEKKFSRICYEILQRGQEKPPGKILCPSVLPGDLKLPGPMQETLGQICCSVMENCRIYEEWDLQRKYPYGRAVTVLLAGPPGTGKTMTAHALSAKLGIPLYQVDLSHVMDKYIGETEKHLEQAFAFAEKTNMILFFDEADSLFGKRGEVTEGKDRYANMEVSYILQRIEEFEGIVVLATNFYGNIDKAFLRRMKYVLKYQMPDESIRRSIWESCLPPETGLPAAGLDIAYLAKQFEFSGGMIKNVVLSACVMALYEKKQIDMAHMLRAVRAEYKKMEWAVSGDMWGEYGYLME